MTNINKYIELIQNVLDIMDEDVDENLTERHHNMADEIQIILNKFEE